MDKLTPNNIEGAAAAMAAQHTATKRFFAKAAIAAAIVMMVLVALSATVGTTLAYFTTYASAKGSIEISLEEQTTIKEDFDSWVKHLTIANNGTDSRPVFVRAKAFAGEEYTLTYSGSGWSQGADGYYYYGTAPTGDLAEAKGGTILMPGKETSQLDVTISDVPAGAKPGDNFNVVIVYETTPVLYDESGEPYANWNNILDNGNLSEGGDQ